MDLANRLDKETSGIQLEHNAQGSQAHRTKMKFGIRHACHDDHAWWLFGLDQLRQKVDPTLIPKIQVEENNIGVLLHQGESFGSIARRSDDDHIRFFFDQQLQPGQKDLVIID